MAKVADLLDFGIPRVCYCRTDPSLIIEDDILIFVGITNGYNSEILKLFVRYFGIDKIKKSFNDRRYKVSDRFYNDLFKALDEYDR